MTRNSTACAILALLPGLAACGSSQSASPAPVTVTAAAPTPTPTTATAAAPAPQRTTTEKGPPASSGPGTTRTAPGPAFTRATGGTGDLPAAVAKLRGLGFTPVSTSTYDPNQTLRVLIGSRTGSADGHNAQAFFFDGARYLGTDAAATSGRISVVGHGDTSVTLRYGIYRPGDADCCPSATPRNVSFVLDGGRLVAAGSIPSAAVRR